MKMFGEHDPNQDYKRARELEARAAFKGFLDYIGVEVVEDALESAKKNQEKGLHGITIPSEDHSVMLAIDESGVSFSVEDWGPYKVPTDTAIAAISEVRSEQETSPQ